MATTFAGMQIAVSRPCSSSSQRFQDAGAVVLGVKSKVGSWNKLASACCVSSVQPFQRGFTSPYIKFNKINTKAMAESSENKPVSGLPIDLKGKRAFIAGVADDNGYGWEIAKSLAAAGAEILVGTWVPAMNIFESSLRYGGGMSSAKAALESDTRVLAFEAGRKRKIRVNTISAGPLRSCAAKAIGFIDMMIDYSLANALLQKELSAEEVGNAAAFLASPLASAITGAVVYVDNGLNAMGVGVDSPIFKDLDIPNEQH